MVIQNWLFHLKAMSAPHLSLGRGQSQWEWSGQKQYWNQSGSSGFGARTRRSLCEEHGVRVSASILKPPICCYSHQSSFMEEEVETWRLNNVSGVTHVSKASSPDPRALAFYHCATWFLCCLQPRASGPLKESIPSPGYSRPCKGWRWTKTSSHFADDKDSLCVTARWGQKHGA